MHDDMKQGFIVKYDGDIEDCNGDVIVDHSDHYSDSDYHSGS